MASAKKSEFALRQEQQEVVVQKCLKAYARGSLPLEEVVKKWGCSLGTVKKRLRGRTSHSKKHTDNHKLERLEEKELRRYILKRDDEGNPTRYVEVKEMAKELLLARGVEEIKFGKDWERKFADRTNGITPNVMDGYVCRDGTIESAQELEIWFQKLKQTISDHSISVDQIWKLDITGFQMGRVGKKTDGKIESNPEEWVSIIECISANGDAMTPFFMFKHTDRIPLLSKHIPEEWKAETIPPQWGNGLIETEWLEKHFHRETRPENSNTFRLLLIDGHKRQHYEAFKRICETQNIIAVYTPPNSSYNFKALDVSAFPRLKKFYRSRIEKALNEVKHKDIVEILVEYTVARAGTTMGSRKIKEAFRSSGLDCCW
ncbi:hypothetical protein JCM33374_g1509 [Metschnikowia sp. JCM 33374]|nr:hypothetical protein JCM33374_g1509 [Metschnikowia sp. JCM 33374]